MRKSSDYSHTDFYCLESKDGLHQYVGSTTNLYSRKHHHKYRCTNKSSSNYDLHVYKKIRQYGGLDNFRYRILDTLDLTNNSEKLRVESYYIDLLNPDLNTIRRYQT